MNDKQTFSERFNRIDPQAIRSILDWLEGASDEGAGRSMLMEAFKQYLIYSDDDPEKKRYLTSLYNCLDVALGEFDDAYTQPKYHENNPPQEPQRDSPSESTPVMRHIMTVERQ